MKIVGLDVCKNSVVAWVLETIPKNFRTHFREHKRSKDDDSLTFTANADGVKRLLELAPDAVIMEPTGVHYSWIWAHICQSEGVRVLWVGHQEAVHYRKQNKLPDKNDQADALALAAYAIAHWGAPGVKQNQVKKGFGNLVISQTAAYACRLLFKELKRSSSQ